MRSWLARWTHWVLAKRGQVVFRGMLLALGLFAALPAFAPHDAESQLAGDMTGNFPIGIENETQRRLFFSLICTCGCPPQTLGTCECGVANARRLELKDELAQGMSIEQIQKAYVARFGDRALSVPTTSLVWAIPLAIVVVGAGFVGFTIRRWKRRSAGDLALAKSELAAAGTPANSAATTAGPPAHDAYDDKLDRELGELDRE